MVISGLGFRVATDKATRKRSEASLKPGPAASKHLILRLKQTTKPVSIPATCLIQNLGV